MRVSVITAVYNRAKTIADALDSVRNQSYPHIEHVVVDGGSTDGTVQIVQSRRASISTFLGGPDKGIYDALNKGINASSGDVFGFLHSDDVFADNDVIADIARRFDAPEVDAVYGDLEYVSSDLGRVIRRWRSGAFEAAKLARGWMPPHPTLYLRRRIAEQIGGFDTSFQIAADYEFMLRAMTRAKLRFAYIPRVLVRMRVGGASNKSLAHLFRKSREDLRAMRAHGVGGIATLLSKNFSKLSQFWSR